MIGKILGPYEILERLGAGGMGEVWLAQDTRLGRKVAVKILPTEFAAMPDRLARFEQEARAAAALNHPHIAVLHDVGEADGVHFMVQEHLEGQTLQELLEKGRPPLRQALALGAEIVEALRAAHDAGIVHRDLKPANVFVTPDGHAKVLDFGLAKLTEMAAVGDGSASMSPTVLGTAAGQMMGTAGYMAPEQIEGTAVDHRADLFAFGCVLYEMAAGSQPFRGKNMIDTLHRVANLDADGLVTIDGSLPAELQRILDKALAKDPAERYQTAGDLAVDLRALAGSVESGQAVPVALEGGGGASGGLSPPIVAGIAAGALLVGALAAWMSRPAAEPPPVTHFTFDAVANFQRTGRRVLDVSPDGRLVAFRDDGGIWVRDLADPALRLVTDSPGTSPLFSPDGQWIAFHDDGFLQKVPTSGGSALELVACENPAGTSWGADGTILIGQGAEGVLRVSEDGGEAEQLLDLEPGERAQGPLLLPGGEWLVFTLAHVTDDWSDGRIVAQSLVNGDRRLLVPGGTDPRYLASGHLTFVRHGSLLAVPFDAAAGEITGGVVPLVSEVQMTVGSSTGSAFYDVSDAGDLVYVSGVANLTGNLLRIATYDLEGNLTTPDLAPADFDRARFSPYGERIAVAVAEDGTEAIWIYDLDRGTRQRLTGDDEAGADDPVWSPDGAWIYYSGTGGIDRRRSDFTGAAERIAEISGLPQSLSPDGTRIAAQISGNQSQDIVLIDVATGEQEPIATTGAIEVEPEYSPDGRYIVYTSNEGDGVFRAYVRDLENGVRHVVSQTGVAQPIWSPDGATLYFEAPNPIGPDRMMAVPVTTDDGFRLGALAELFEADAIAGFPRDDLDLSPDGTRFLFLTREQPSEDTVVTGPSAIHVVLGWGQELRRRVTPR